MCAMLDAWHMANRTQDTVDYRVGITAEALSGYVRSGLKPMGHTGSIKGADCLRFITDVGRFWFHETLPAAQQRTWEDGLKFLMDLLHATCDADDPEAVPTLISLKLATIRALCRWSKEVPGTEHTIVIHELVHICDMVYRWNNVRNFWCFLTERFVGYIIGFIHNRDKVELGILLGYACTKLNFAAPPARLEQIRYSTEHLEEGMARRGFLLTSDDILASKITIAGSGTYIFHFLIFQRTGPLFYTGDVRWKIKRRYARKTRSQPGMVTAARAHCLQAQIRCGDLSGWLNKLTGQVHISGYKWKQGTQCRYRLPTDSARQSLRIGVLDHWVVVPTDGGADFLIACVIESHLFNTINGFDIVDITHASPRTSFFHISHIVSLVMFVSYWELQARHLKVVLHVASTR